MAARILIISPSWLGDIIMSQSLLHVIKTQEPDAHISVYAPAYAHCILERMNEVDEILTNPFAHKEFNLKLRYAEGKRLKELHFDRAYILPNSFKSALMPFFAHIKERIGFKGESRYLVLNRMRHDKKAFARMVERYVALAYINDPQVKDSASLPAFAYPQLKLQAPAPELLTKLGLEAEQQRPWLALGCGANYGPAKLWPVEFFAQVSAHFITQRGFAVLALGSNKDHDTVEQIKAQLKIQAPHALQHFHDIAGQTDLTEALDIVGLFGSTSTTYTPPLSEKAVCLESTQPCHPCFEHTCKYGTYLCLRELAPEQVISKLSELLERFPDPKES